MSTEPRSELEKLLVSLTEKLYLFPNPGNAGDSLIAVATILFLNKIGIDYEIVDSHSFDGTGKVVAYAGGGNFGGNESRAGRVVAKYHKSAKNFIIFPHTIFGANDLLSEFGSNCHIFCREKVSYEHVKSISINANIYLQDDIVFTATSDDIFALESKPSYIKAITKELINKVKGIDDYDFGISLKGALTYFQYISQKKLLNRKSNSKGVLNAFRTDVEKTSIELPSDNVDLSAVLELSSCNSDLAIVAAQRLLREINAFDTIRTNRLHIAIGAILLGKQVELYGNNYYKIRAIYDYSIKDKFQNVQWFE